MAKKEPIKKRRHLRFKPEASVVATIDLNAERKLFTPSILALVFSESYGGCGLVMLSSKHLQVADLCKVKIGELAPLRAEVVWRTQLDDQVMKLGFKLLD